MYFRATISLVPLALALAACSETGLTNLDDGVGPGTCQLDVPIPPTPSVDETCGQIPEVTDPWNVVEEWTFFAADQNNQVENSSYSPPLVAHLQDTNDDGVVDEHDHPDIVMVTFPADLSSTREGSLVAVDGVTRQPIWQAPGVYYGTGHAVADVTGDGSPDVVAFDAGRRVVLFDAQGQQIWRTTQSVAGMYPQATVADIDGDGVAEIIADNLVLEGPTGQLRFTLDTSPDIPYTMPSVGDIDLDGQQEIVYGNKVYRSDGTVMWSTNLAGDYGHFSAILNADDDPEGEVAMIGASRMVIFDTDGTVLHYDNLPRRGGSAPCVADFDGDGQSEIGIGETSGSMSGDPSVFQVYELDGTLLWSRDVDDQSGIAGCSGYDIDGDGALEILYADENTFYIFDGATGEVRYSSSDHASGTVYEYPVVADVDQDGSAEILVVNSNDENMPLLTVFGHVNDGWAPVGQTWPIHDFAVTNITPQDTVPSTPPLYWAEHNTLRARPVVDSSPVDFTVSIVDVCTASCDPSAPLRVAVQVYNDGPMWVPAGVGVTLYTDGPTGRTPLGTNTLAPMEPGRIYNLTFETTVGDVGDGELVARVDDIGTGSGLWHECHEDNNQFDWGRVTCDP